MTYLSVFNLEQKNALNKCEHNVEISTFHVFGLL